MLEQKGIVERETAWVPPLGARTLQCLGSSIKKTLALQIAEPRLDPDHA